MAKKKTVTTVEEVDETPQEPQEIDYKKDIEGKTLEQVATETPGEKVEETPVETPAEEETEEVEFDPEAFKKEVTDSATTAAEKKLLEKLQGKTEEETKDNVDAYQAFADKFTEENGRTPTWVEVSKFIKEESIKEIKAEQAEEARKQVEESEAQQKAQETDQENVNKYVDGQFNELYQRGFPKIQDPKNENDPGLQARKALAQQTMEINAKRLQEGLPTKTLVEVFYTEYKAPDRQLPGYDAPVSPGRSSAPGDSGEEINYARDIKGRNFFDIVMGRKQG